MREQLSKYDIRLEMLKRNQKKFNSYKSPINLPHELLDSLTYSYDNLQNNPELTSIFKESLFLSRELTDFIIHKLHFQFRNNVPKDFKKFIISLTNNRYAELNSPCIQYLSNPNVIKKLIMIRLIRNKMKNELDLTFHCTNQINLELQLDVPFDSSLRDEIPNFDDLMDIAKNREHCTNTSNINVFAHTIHPNDFMNDVVSIFNDLKEICALK